MHRLFVTLAAVTLLIPQLAHASDYAPIDCTKASSPAEKTICKSYALGQDEARLSTLYAVATSLVAMGQRENIKEAQRKWIATRDACGDSASCLKSAYDERIGSLNATVMAIASRGPF